MNITTDFVTNSSSASFVILKKNLTDMQIQMIHNHIDVGMIIANHQGYGIYNMPWSINETPTEIEGHTGMDNFDMSWFLDAIGVHEDYIKYENNG